MTAQSSFLANGVVFGGKVTGISKIEIKKEGGLSPWETAFLLLRGEY